MVRRIVVSVVCAALLAGCGGGGSSGSPATSTSSTTRAPAAGDEKMVELLEHSLLENPDPAFPIDEVSARCFAEGLVERFGVTGLLRLGLSTETLEAGAQLATLDLTRSQAEGFADVMLRCFDFAAGVAAQYDGMVSRESIDCIGEALPVDGGFRDLLVRMMANERVTTDDAVAALSGVARACLTEEEIARIRPQG